MMPTRSRSGSPPSAVPVISECDVRDQLGRILASVDFHVPERVRRFLSFVVEETLCGRTDRIKAYAIAVEVFGRDANFDVLNDPVVRIEAGRLRRGLERYYLLEGSTDPLVIEIAKGGYVPSFRWQLNDQIDPAPLSPSDPPPDEPSRQRMGDWLRLPWLVGATSALAISSLVAFVAIANGPIPAAPVSPARLSLVVKPFVNLTEKAEFEVFAAGLADDVISQLVPNEELTIFRSELPAALGSSASAAQSDRQFGRRHILEGVIRAGDGKLRITSRLLDGQTTAIIWAGSYEADQNAGSGFNLDAAKIAAAVSHRLRPPATMQ